MSDHRTHFVYTAFDKAGRILYIGCTKDLDGRMAAHRTQSDWYEHAVRLHLRGPYHRSVGFEVERTRLALDRPLYAFHPKRRTLLAIWRRVFKREHAALVTAGGDYFDTIRAAIAVADAVIPYPGNRQPVDVTDDLLRRAFAAEDQHRSAVRERLTAAS